MLLELITVHVDITKGQGTGLFHTFYHYWVLLGRRILFGNTVDFVYIKQGSVEFCGVRSVENEECRT